MTPYLQGIHAFRRRGLERREEPTLPAAFVLDSHMSVAAQVVASFHPAATLQLRDGARRTRTDDVAKTLEHAVTELGARTIVLCNEDVRPPELSSLREGFLAESLWLSDHLWLQRLFRDHDVVIESMWFDVEEGDLHLFDAATRRFDLLADSGIEAFVERVRARASLARGAA
jgi:hypothetical protein